MCAALRRGNGPAGGGKAWERPGKVRTAPMPVADPRREHIRVRAALTGGLPKAGMKASSPNSYGTPKGMLSPSAAAAAAPPKVPLPTLSSPPPIMALTPSVLSTLQSVGFSHTCRSAETCQNMLGLRCAWRSRWRRWRRWT